MFVVDFILLSCIVSFWDLPHANTSYYPFSPPLLQGALRRAMAENPKLADEFEGKLAAKVMTVLT